MYTLAYITTNITVTVTKAMFEVFLHYVYKWKIIIMIVKKF